MAKNASPKPAGPAQAFVDDSPLARINRRLESHPQQDDAPAPAVEKAEAPAPEAEPGPDLAAKAARKRSPLLKIALVALALSAVPGDVLTPLRASFAGLGDFIAPVQAQIQAAGLLPVAAALGLIALALAYSRLKARGEKAREAAPERKPVNPAPTSRTPVRALAVTALAAAALVGFFPGVIGMAPIVPGLPDLSSYLRPASEATAPAAQAHIAFAEEFVTAPVAPADPAVVTRAEAPAVLATPAAPAQNAAEAAGLAIPAAMLNLLPMARAKLETLALTPQQKLTAAGGALGLLVLMMAAMLLMMRRVGSTTAKPAPIAQHAERTPFLARLQGNREGKLDAVEEARWERLAREAHA